MKILPFLIFFTIALLSTVKAQNQPFRFEVNFSEFTNLTFQLDCLNNFAYCTLPDYQALWQKEFLKTDEDKKMLDSWGKIRGRYQKYFEIENKVKFPIVPNSAGVSLSTKIQIAGFQAKNLDDYLSRLDLLVLPSEREEFAKVIKHFQPKYSVWWEKEAKIKGAAFDQKTKQLLADERVNGNIVKFYNFYQPNLPDDYLITFNLFYRPQLVKAGSGGQAVENQLVVEFLPDENPKRRIDVVLHEFCHFLLNSLPPEKYAELQGLFIKSGRASAIPAYGLLDESLASALGNGIIARLFTTPESWKEYLAFERSFYNNPNIDKAGKAILPLLDDWLAKNGKLNDENFVKLYLDAIENAFGEKIDAPSFYLGQAFLFLDENFDISFRSPIRQTLNIASLYSEKSDLKNAKLDDYFGNGNLSSVFVVSPKSLVQFGKRKILNDKDFKLISKEKSGLFSFKRNVNSYIFVVLAENGEIALQLIKNLADSTKTFTGKFPKT